SRVTDTNTPEAEQATQPEDDLQAVASVAISGTEGPAFSVERTEDEQVAESLGQEHGLYDPSLDLPGYRVPPLDLLESHGSSRPSVSAEELEDNKNKIVSTLANYGLEIDKIKATIGPTVTLYEIVPCPGVRI